MTERNLNELPAITESKLRELEKECMNSSDIEKVKRYYCASRNLYDVGYDARHHVATAYALIKKLRRKDEVK